MAREATEGLKQLQQAVLEIWFDEKFLLWLDICNDIGWYVYPVSVLDAVTYSKD